MDITTIATLVYIGLLLVFGVISAAVVYHLRRYYLRDDTMQEIMGIAYFAEGIDYCNEFKFAVSADNLLPNFWKL